MLGRKRIILDRDRVRAMHAVGKSVRAIAAKLGVSKSLVANILALSHNQRVQGGRAPHTATFLSILCNAKNPLVEIATFCQATCPLASKNCQC